MQLMHVCIPIHAYAAYFFLDKDTGVSFPLLDVFKACFSRGGEEGAKSLA